MRGDLQLFTTDQRDRYAAWVASMAKKSRGRMKDYFRGVAEVARQGEFYSFEVR